MDTSPRRPILVTRKVEKRDLLVGICLGILLLGFVLWGIVSMSAHVSGNNLTGTIISKHFSPQPEQQITIGKGGLRQRDIPGEYTFEVRVDSQNRTYTVVVDQRDYESHKEGDSFRFFLPPRERR